MFPQALAVSVTRNILSHSSFWRRSVVFTINYTFHMYSFLRQIYFPRQISRCPVTCCCNVFTTIMYANMFSFWYMRVYKIKFVKLWLFYRKILDNWITYYVVLSTRLAVILKFPYLSCYDFSITNQFYWQVGEAQWLRKNLCMSQQFQTSK